MGRARDIAALTVGGSLTPRVVALENNQAALTVSVNDAVSAADGAAAAAATANAGVTSITNRFNAKIEKYARLGSGQENPNGPSLQITQAGSTLWKDMWKMAVPFALKTDDIIIVTSEFEIRNDATYFVEMVTSVILSANSNMPESDEYDITGVRISGANGFNVAPVPNGMHYYNTPKALVYKMTADYNAPYLYVRARARSSAATGAEYCTLMAGGYGQLSIAVLPKGLG